MKIVYDVSLDDMVEFQYFHTLNSAAGKKLLTEGQWWETILFLAFTLGISWALLDAFYMWNVAVPIFLVAAYMFHNRFHERAEKRIREHATAMVTEGDNIGIMGRHEMTLTEEGLEETTEVGSQNNLWGSIDRIVTHDDTTYIYVGSLLAHILPKNAVREGNYNLFITELKKRHHAYLGQTSAP